MPGVRPIDCPIIWFHHLGSHHLFHCCNAVFNQYHAELRSQCGQSGLVQPRRQPDCLKGILRRTTYFANKARSQSSGHLIFVSMHFQSLTHFLTELMTSFYACQCGEFNDTDYFLGVPRGSGQLSAGRSSKCLKKQRMNSS